MLIEDFNFSHGIEFYRVEGEWGKEAEIASIGNIMIYHTYSS